VNPDAVLVAHGRVLAAISLQALCSRRLLPFGMDSLVIGT
jgi:hypothetical protein